MDCRNVHQLIQTSLDRQLSVAEQTDLAAHLAVCPDCASYAVELQVLDALLLAELPQVTPPAGFAAAVMAALPAPARPAKRRSLRRPLIYTAGMVTTAAALLMVVGLTGLFAPDTSLNPNLPQLAWNQPADSPINRLPLVPPPEVDPPAEDDIPIIADDPDIVTPPPTIIDPLNLPAVANNSEESGEFGKITLAEHKDCDVLHPQVNGGIATYFISFESVFYKYEVNCDGSQLPQLIGEVKGLPAQLGYGTRVDAEEGAYYQASSAQGTVAQLRADGLYLMDGNTLGKKLAELSGGSLLSWSADGSKLAYGDNSGHVYIYYMAEGTSLDVASGVTSLCWNGNASLVYTGAENGQIKLFCVTLP